MSGLAQQRPVISLASELGLDWHRPVVAILEHCHNKIASWLADSQEPKSLRDLQDVACKRLSLVFEEFRSDEELIAVIQKYVRLGERGFAAIKPTFTPDVYATLTERHHIQSRDESRYVAFIDLRGEKAARRYFTRWHEIAHLLTLAKQLELPFHRSSTGRDPIEQLMDVIAGEVGFYPPIFRPAVERAFAARPRLTFAAVEQIRAEMCPDASFHATLIACAKRWPGPVLTLEVGMGLKKAEREVIGRRQLAMFGADAPEAKLRALVAVSNAAARKQGLRIHPNMRVPERSLIAAHFHDSVAFGVSGDASGEESLALWEHSDGSVAGHDQLLVECRRVHERVVVLMAPA